MTGTTGATGETGTTGARGDSVAGRHHSVGRPGPAPFIGAWDIAGRIRLAISQGLPRAPYKSLISATAPSGTVTVVASVSTSSQMT
jgi:hypothetical protein